MQVHAEIFRLLQEDSNRSRINLSYWWHLYHNFSSGTANLIQAAAFLIFYSVQDFYTEQYYTFLGVQNDDSDTLPMRIDILFNRMPCNGILYFM